MLRAEGLNGPGVAGVMKASGLTVGGFYKHFRDRPVVNWPMGAESTFSTPTAGHPSEPAISVWVLVSRPRLRSPCMSRDDNTVPRAGEGARLYDRRREYPQELEAIAVALLRAAEAIRSREEGAIECVGKGGQTLGTPTFIIVVQLAPWKPLTCPRLSVSFASSEIRSHCMPSPIR